jgi:hypothetical protein
MLAVMVALCDELTAVAVAANVALVALAATVIVAGTVTAESSLARLTDAPLLPAAELSVTEQLSVPAPVRVALVHVMALREGCETGGGAVTAVPVPLRVTDILPADELLTSVSVPAADPTAVGLNCTLTLTLAPPATVTGSVAWVVRANALPATPICVMFTDSVLAFFSETVAVADWPTVTFPKESALADATNVPAVTALVFPAMLPQPDIASATPQKSTASNVA